MEQKFTIHWRDSGGLVDTAAYIFLDGFEVPGYFLFGFGEAHRGAARISPTLQRPFVFAKPDESMYTLGLKCSNACPYVVLGFPPYPWTPESGGVIQLAITRIKRVGASAPNVPRQPPGPVKSDEGNPITRYDCILA